MIEESSSAYTLNTPMGDRREVTYYVRSIDLFQYWKWDMAFFYVGRVQGYQLKDRKCRIPT